MKRKNEIDKETQKAIDKAVIKSLFRMLYLDDLVDRDEYERLLEFTDKKFEDDNLLSIGDSTSWRYIIKMQNIKKIYSILWYNMNGSANTQFD